MCWYKYMSQNKIFIFKIYLASVREYAGKYIKTSDVSGTTIGLNDSEWGAIGVRIVQGTEGATMGPPAETL